MNKADFNHRGVQYMRSPSMLISAERINNITNNVSALFVCDNAVGDDLLRKMESPSHTEWSENFLHMTDKEKKKYKSLPLKIKQFVREEILHLFSSDDISVINIDLGNMLNPFAATSTSTVDSDSTKKGKEKGKVKDKKVSKRVQLPSKSVSSGLEKEHGRGQGKSENPSYRTAKIDHPGTGYRHRNPADGDGIGFDDIDRDKPGTTGKVVDLDFDMLALTRKDQIWHLLYFTPTHTYHNCSIYIDLGTDNLNDKNCEIAEVKSTQKLTVKENCIRGLSFEKGRQTIIQVRFSDNLKHSLTIRSFRNE